MVLALNVTAEDDIAAVLIEVTGAAAGAVTITRSDHNGTRDVRLFDGQEPISGSLTVRDFEPALFGTATYTVTDSSAATATDTTTTNVTAPVLMAAVLPTSRQSLAAITDYDASRDDAGQVHWVKGRPDPLIITSPLRLREGSLTVWTETYEDALAVVATAESGEVLMLRQPTYVGMDMYFTPQSLRVSQAYRASSSWRWEVAVSYTEADIPSGALLSAAGWNYDAHTATGMTYAQSLVAFPTYNDRVIGP